MGPAFDRCVSQIGSKPTRPFTPGPLRRRGQKRRRGLGRRRARSLGGSVNPRGLSILNLGSWSRSFGLHWRPVGSAKRTRRMPRNEAHASNAHAAAKRSACLERRAPLDEVFDVGYLTYFDHHPASSPAVSAPFFESHTSCRGALQKTGNTYVLKTPHTTIEVLRAVGGLKMRKDACACMRSRARCGAGICRIWRAASGRVRMHNMHAPGEPKAAGSWGYFVWKAVPARTVRSKGAWPRWLNSASRARDSGVPWRRFS